MIRHHKLWLTVHNTSRIQYRITTKHLSTCSPMLQLPRIPTVASLASYQEWSRCRLEVCLTFCRNAYIHDCSLHHLQFNAPHRSMSVIVCVYVCASVSSTTLLSLGYHIPGDVIGALDRRRPIFRSVPKLMANASEICSKITKRHETNRHCVTR